ncbi:cAMP-independent regulatory protein pac2 [Diaporthe amygdali]|uniref:cAMP-independent regulatory protein pac2 n=1 Tax=Phomopsis amygdali TaxID=1214568 RepID=UPI0022FE946E|nr:cAMP-independent regulatory protein pac2 [Diaporthe amygdali]KAJ0116842.1 cAMP-independent regulatory protein pac2 [Diaporthe amygdali]
MAVRQSNMMETYHGLVRTPADAIKLFEACRLGLLPRVQRRLSEKERQSIRSGSVFVWDEREAGMRRWTDGKSWSASRVSGSFLTYREMEGKRGGGFGASRRSAGKTPDSGRGSDEDPDDGEPDGYRYKADGLMKQSFSITTSQGQHLHLISYFSRPHPSEPELPQPSSDPSLRHIVPVKGMYPESSMNEQPVPAMTRTPMASAYAPAPPHPAQYHPQYAQQSPYPGWPPSPVATPPYSHYTVSAPYPPAQLPPPPPAGVPYPPPHHGHPHQYLPGPPPPHPAYDRPQLPPPGSASQPRVTPSMLPHYSQGQPQLRSPHLAQIRINEESPRLQQLQLKAGGAGRTMPGPLPAVHSSTPPPRALSQSPPNVGNKASLSALLHPQPTPTSSEPNSAAGSNSATSSPRGTGAAMGSGTMSSSAMNNAAAAGLMAKGFHEDARALDVLNKKFSI